jgi:adenylosuccinate lyase
MRAWDEQRDFRELVADDDEIRSRLDQAELDLAFDLADAVRHADEIVARLRQLDQPREVSTRV